MTRDLPNAETDIHGDAWVARLRATSPWVRKALAGTLPASRPLPVRCPVMLAYAGWDLRYSIPRQCLLERGHVEAHRS